MLVLLGMLALAGSPSCVPPRDRALNPCLPIGAAATRAAARCYPNVSWEEKDVLVADINCDGNEDYSIAGTADSTFYVGVVTGPLSSRSRVYTLDFPLDPLAQDGLGGWPATLYLERLDYNPTDVPGGPDEGFQMSDSCRGLLIEAGDIDPFHVFWNHKANRLDWWRL